VELGTTDEQDYEEIVEEYEEEVFVLEEFQEPPVTDATYHAPTQGKHRCMTRIF
jgi:hypothetical protein